MKRKYKIILLIVITFVLIITYNKIKYASYDPISSLKIEKAIVKIYFSNDEHLPAYDSYKGKKPDYKKHRLIDYLVDARNTGPYDKKMMFLIPLVPRDFEKYILDEDKGLIYNIPRVKNGKVFGVDMFYTYLTEGDPQKVEKIISKYNKAKIIWEENGKKYEKVIDMKLEITD